MVYREGEFRETPAQRLAFPTTSVGDVIVAAFGFVFLVFFVYVLPWDARVDGHCDRTTCTFGTLAIPLASIDHLEVEVDDDEWTTMRVVAVTTDGERHSFGDPSSNTDFDEKRAFVASFTAFRQGPWSTWSASYNTSDIWIARLMHAALVIVVLVWFATRKRVVLERAGDQLRVTRSSWLRRRTATFTQLPTQLTSGELRGSDGALFTLGTLTPKRERQVRAFLGIAEPISDYD